MQTRRLPVKLTAAEVKAKGEELARAVDAYNVRELQNKEQAKANAEALKDMRAAISKTAVIVDTGVEHREVTGVWVRDGLRKNWVRDDTHEIVETRDLEADELQGGLFDDIENDRETH